MRRVIVIPTVVAVTLIGGCSPSSSSPDAAAHTDGPTNSKTNHDAAHPDGDAKMDSPTDANKDRNDSSQARDSGLDACAPLASLTFTPPPYVSATVHPGACTVAATAEFVAACGFDTGSAVACSAWAAMNVSDGGNQCGSCIVEPDNSGGVWLEPDGGGAIFGSGFPNYGACIQITDPQNGPACASAWNDDSACVYAACDKACMAATTGALSNCKAMASALVCKTYASAKTTLCALDFGGIGDSCFPSLVSQDWDDDYTYILTLLCGGTAKRLGDAGSDAKPPGDAARDAKPPGDATHDAKPPGDATHDAASDATHG